jgi:hypothetical protein
MMDNNCKADVFDVAEAADRIEALTEQLKTVLDREAATTARYDAKTDELEAKLAKAVRGLNAICVWGEDTYARDMARTTLAEIEGKEP